MLRRCLVVAIATLTVFVGASVVASAASDTYTIAGETNVSSGERGTFIMSCGTDRMTQYKIMARHITLKRHPTRTGISIDYVGHKTEEQTLTVQLTCQPAKPSVYKVTARVTLAVVNGSHRLVPRQPDDELTVTCKRGDKMTDHTVNNPALVQSSWIHIDGSGITVVPAVAERTAILQVTIICQET
jgi:hypothetical protein